MRKTDLINEYEYGKRWIILGTDFEIIQYKDKKIELLHEDSVLANCNASNYNICNYNKDYLFMVANPDTLQIYNMKRDDWCNIRLSDDKTIEEIKYINDCFGDAKIDTITENGWHNYDYDYYEFEKEEQHYSKSDLIIENDNRGETWKLGNSGFEITHGFLANTIYFKKNGKVLCSFNSNNMNIDNDYNQNKPLKYAMSIEFSLNIIRVWNVDKNNYLSIRLDEDKRIDNIKYINDIIDCDVSGIGRYKYTRLDENNEPVHEGYKGEK